MIFIYILVFAFFGLGVFLVLKDVLILPDARASRNLASLKLKQSNNVFLRIASPLIVALSKIIKINKFRRTSLKKNLERANLPFTPESFFANAIVKGALTALLIVPFALLNNTVITVSIGILSILVFFREIDKVNDSLKEVNRRILNELPRFVRFMARSMEKSNDVLMILIKYRKIAGEELGREIDRLVADMQTSNHEEALRRFEIRINIRELSSFVNGLIEFSKGVDQAGFFYTTYESIQNLSTELIKRALAKRPSKIKRATVAMVMCMMAVFIVPMIIQIIDGFSLLQ